ncbi:MAG: hypothetical protein ABIS21_05305 [Acidimicrobiales bacterium]
MMVKVTLIDTSILCELLQVPGKCEPERKAEMWDEVDVRSDEGERMMLPMTALVETGNHIVQCGGDRHVVAQRLVDFLHLVLQADSPFLVPELEFGRDFVAALAGGASTGQTLAQLATHKVGTGDVAILVQRDQLLAKGDFTAVEVWTLDQGLHQLASTT